MNEDFLRRKLNQRRDASALRELRLKQAEIDFCSNDYLGIVKRNLIHNNNHNRHLATGSTGSRLISGNYELIEYAEKEIAAFHHAPAGLIFNSGYDANLGLLGTIPQRNDTVLYDHLSHASIRDGIRLSHAFSFSFAHNDVADLEKKLIAATGKIFVVTESVFSMDGDKAPLAEIADLCTAYNAMLIVDEAHATGVLGNKGEGLVQDLGIEDRCFARVHTFGKAVGCHGAIVVGSENLKQYLVNFCRPFIYTTAMPPAAVNAIINAYTIFPEMDAEREHIRMLIGKFRQKAANFRLCNSVTPIQGVIIPGNDTVKTAAKTARENGYDVRAILYPTVPAGMERLRIVLHSFNTPSEVEQLTAILESRK